jgi:hypothetical protein
VLSVVTVEDVYADLFATSVDSKIVANFLLLPNICRGFLSVISLSCLLLLIYYVLTCVSAYRDTQ